MKAKFEFDLPEDQDDFDIYRKAMAYYCGLQEFDNWLRSLDKYTEQTVVNIQEARQKLRELVEEEF